MAVRYFMRTIILLFILGAFAAAQNPKVSESNNLTCPGHSADLLYSPVVLAMWSQDEGEHPYATASGFIRIAVHPTWSQEFFLDVKLNRTGAPTVVFYSLPKDAKTVTVLLERELKRHSSTDAKALANTLPIRRRTLQ